MQHDLMQATARRNPRIEARPRRTRALALGLAFAALLSRAAIAQPASDAAASSRQTTTTPATARSSPSEHPFLWKIERDPPAFLFGTIHLADERILDIPPVVETAFEFVDALITEIPMDMQTMVNEMAPRMLLPEGQTLSTVLPGPLYERLEKYLAARGQPMQSMERCKVWVLTTQIALIDLLNEVGANEGLDVRLAREARTLEKETGGLETLGEQLDALEGLTTEEQIRSLARTLAKLEENARKGRRVGREMLDSYFGGDEKRLVKLMDEWLDVSDPLDAKSYDLLITQRDRRMAERIDSRLKQSSDQTCMFAIGAYHLIGPKLNVIDHLEKRGWKIRRLAAKDTDGLRAELAKSKSNNRAKTPASQPARK